MEVIKDDIFYAKRMLLKSSISYLNAIKQLLPPEVGIKVAKLAAENYILSYYQDVFKNTLPGSQERFDKFRKHYESYPKTSTYCEICASNKSSIIVRYKRCTYAEILYDEHLSEFASLFCNSDMIFTKALLPGVDFVRKSSIISGDNECLMIWTRTEF